VSQIWIKTFRPPALTHQALTSYQIQKHHDLAQALSTALAQGLARIDAQCCCCTCWAAPDADRAWLMAHDTDALPPATARSSSRCASAAVAGEPVAYLTGRKAFYGLPLQVDERVLDPRPDTETLVDWALEVLAHQPAPRVVDLGTGSGAIALALQQASAPMPRCWPWTPAQDALAVAQANASGWACRCVPARQLAAGVAGGFRRHRFQPALHCQRRPAPGRPHARAAAALASGADGLDDMRTIVAQAPARLAPGGWLLLEHGYDQAEAVQALLRPRALCRCKAAKTSPASCVARAGSGRQ
jgi:release factor glutamine methyltransferase